MKQRGLLGRLGVVGLVALGCILSGSGEAGAQAKLPPVNHQLFRPAPGPADYFTVYGSGLTARNEWTVGGYLNYADAPLRLASIDNPSAQVLDSVIAGDLLATYGLFGVAELGLVLPVTLVQTSEDLTPLVTQRGDGADSIPKLSSFALSDPRLNVKFEFLNILDGVGVALATSFYLPLGDEEAMAGDGSFGLDSVGVVDALLPFGIRVAGNLGVRFRSDGRSIRAAWIGNEVLWGAGAVVPLWSENLDLVMEVHGGIPMGSGPKDSVDEVAVPAEFNGGLRFAITEWLTMTAAYGKGLSEGLGAPDNRLIVGLGGWWVSGGKWNWDYDGDGFVGEDDQCPRDPEDRDGYRDGDGCPDPDNDGDGIPDKRDKCPDAVVEDALAVGPDGCPDNDLDGDGIPNDRDKCPEDPEDYDGFEDSDGCPDIDNDKDGILDIADSCPDSAETFNGVVDEDGCPEIEGQRVIVTKKKIEILENVYFATGKDVILPKSYPVLDEVANVLLRNPDIKLLQIEGHTDSQGSDSYNLRLSQRRADAVKRYLMENHGLRDERLTAVGYGEEKPIAPNDTADGRGRNRRVEFVILERGAAGSGGDDPFDGETPF